MSSKYIEGVAPSNPHAILVDDLLFAGESKSGAIELLRDHNIEVTDVLVIIDRQLERKMVHALKKSMASGFMR